MTKCRDGVWRSVVFDKFYDNKMHIDELYRMELAHGLKELGYALELKKDKSNHWTFEIKGVSKENIEEFSQRRNDILEAAKEIGRDDAEGLAYIAKTTRGEKMECNNDILQQNWESHAISLEAVREVVNRGALPKTVIDMKKEVSRNKCLIRQRGCFYEGKVDC